MEDQFYFSNDEMSELLDTETLRMVEELTAGIEPEPYPNRGGEEPMISLTALRGNAEHAAEAQGHLLCWDSNTYASCGLCDAEGFVSLDPLITNEQELGTFYHGPLFNEECGLNVYETEVHKKEETGV
jgi:hypothetical protein